MLTDSQEHFWGVELSKDSPTYTWTFKEEDEDEDFMIHTLFLKNAVLSTSALKGERNIIQVETQNFDKKDVKQPLLSLTLGQMDMCNLDVSFGHETPVTFRLIEGSGPIALGGQQLVEFPPEEMNSQDESALEDTMESEEEEESPKKPRKRKAGAAADKKVRKKGKMEESMSSADDSMEDDEEEEEETEEDDEEDMEEEESDEGDKKKKKGKVVRRARSRSRSKGRRSTDIKVTLKKGKERRIVKAKRKVNK